MLIEFSEILHDLELKRAAALDDPERPSVEFVAAIAGLDIAGLELLVVQEDGGERPFTVADGAEPVADALATLALASGEPVADTVAARAIIAAISTDVLTRLSDAVRGGAQRITAHDLSTVIEAALISAGYHEIAKALVLRRGLAPAGAGGASASSQSRVVGAVRLIRRSGEVAAWHTGKIEVAIRKAFLSLALDSEPATALADRVAVRAHGLGAAYVSIETVQDMVQEELVLAGHMRVAERYIVYRAERAILRAQEQTEVQRAAGPPPLPVIETDGTESAWTGADLRARIAFAQIGLDLPLDDATLERELRRAIRPGVGRVDLQRLVVLNAKALVERDSDFSRFAGRILLTYVYEETLGWDIVRDGVAALGACHARALTSMLARGVEIKRIDAKLLDYDLPRLAAALDPTADLDFDFLGLQTLYDRYLIVDKTGATPRRIEAPQLFWIRVAMGICLAEPDGQDRDARVLDLYTIYKQRRFCSSTPTLFNAGTPHSQLSSCYLYQVRGHPGVDRRPRHRRERDVLEVGRWPGRLVDRSSRHRLSHRVDQRREPGRGPVPQAPQRPAGRRQPGRKARRLRLRLPGGVAQRHPRVPRAAARHRGRAPPHPRHEHRLLDP